MAKKYSDSKGEYVLVERGDTLSQIAVDYAGGYSKYKQLAAINNISNPNLIYVGQKIYLTSSGSSSSASSSTSTNDNKPTINHFGEQSDNEGTLFATWSWGKVNNTESYKVLWTYDTGDGVWFGSPSTVSVDADAPNQAQQSTFSIPTNATRVRFKVKPISKKKKSGNTEVNYWDADWSDTKTWTDGTPLKTPGIPSVTIDKYKLTATLDSIDTDGTHIQFQVVKNNAASPFNTSGKVQIVTAHASYSCNVDAGAEYKVRCRACKGNDYSEWSGYSSNIATIPATPGGITTVRANSETSVYLEWTETATATSYDIEYATKKEYFDGSDQTTTQSGIEFTHYEKTGLESGQEYFFRVRATNAKGSSGWSEIKSVIVGKKPAAPTTWSSTTTAVTGEDLTLYWVHNTEDGSSQTYAELELYVDGFKETYTIKNSTEEDEKDKTSFYKVDTSIYVDGTKLQWRVRTRGIANTYGDWSVERTVDIYSPPTLELTLTDLSKNPIEVLNQLPVYVYGLPGKSGNQSPIGYNLVITSNELYETLDNVGNDKIVNIGDAVYSKYFNTMTDSLLVELSAGNIDLQNGISYTISCSVTMSSGLTANATYDFTVAWDEVTYQPNAEIGVDMETMTATIRPYCRDGVLVNYKVNSDSGTFTKTTEALGSVWGEPTGSKTTTGELVYSGVTDTDEEVYFCTVEETTPVTNVLLSVYRREFDGSFTELAVNLDGEKSTAVTDPHPALDFARYRIVAIDKDTQSVSFYDPPGYPIGGKAIIIQWDEQWSNFEATSEDALVQPPWAGSMLKLPYNVDITDGAKPDVQLIEYIGRPHPVSYYGTQVGQTATWNVAIESDDVETIYALRRLSRWMGDVYVREPSGSGYWANITVSFNKKHCEVTIPVTLEIARVEGGA